VNTVRAWVTENMNTDSLDCPAKYARERGKSMTTETTQALKELDNILKLLEANLSNLKEKRKDINNLTLASA
jgi:hypothetical protein